MNLSDLSGFHMVSGVHRRLLPLLFILLATVLPAGCTPSPRVMLEKYLEGMQAQSSSTVETTTVECASCPEMLTDWLDESQVTGWSRQASNDIHVLAIYAVDGDEFTLLELPSAPVEYETWQQDAALHQQAWDITTRIIPPEYRQEVIHFVIFSDGPAGALGAVEETSQPGAWTIAVDIQDTADLPTFATTLIHETAHLISLDTTQVETYLPLFEHPGDATRYEQGEAACDTYFLHEGCSLPGSYLNLFFENFWVGLWDEWAGIQLEKDTAARTRLMTDLHDRHADEFVSSYAVTSPEEDLAESFLYFVLSPSPTGKSLAEEKVLFFQQFPELVNLRQQMRTNLCTILEP